jgi:hypothetical protein
MGLFADLLEGLLDESHSHRHGLSRLRSIVTSMVHTDFLYGALYIKLNIYICINIQHQMWTKTAGALVFQDRALCSVPTSLHPNPDSSLGTDPAFAMMVL